MKEICRLDVWSFLCIYHITRERQKRSKAWITQERVKEVLGKYILCKYIFCNFFLYSTKHQMISYAGLIFIPYFAIFCEFMPRFNFLCRKNHICAELLEGEYLEIIPFWIIWDQVWCAKMFIEIIPLLEKC